MNLIQTQSTEVLHVLSESQAGQFADDTSEW
jgi:hypothetical protein